MLGEEGGLRVQQLRVLLGVDHVVVVQRHFLKQSPHVTCYTPSTGTLVLTTAAARAKFIWDVGNFEKLGLSGSSVNVRTFAKLDC